MGLLEESKICHIPYTLLTCYYNADYPFLSTLICSNFIAYPRFYLFQEVFSYIPNAFKYPPKDAIHISDLTESWFTCLFFPLESLRNGTDSSGDLMQWLILR